VGACDFALNDFQTSGLSLSTIYQPSNSFIVIRSAKFEGIEGRELQYISKNLIFLRSSRISVDRW